MRRWTVLVAVFCLLATGSVVAGAEENPVAYTGCLGAGGNILNVAIGDEPAKPCTASMTEITWNAEGPPGPKGETGEQGPPGPESEVVFTRIHKTVIGAPLTTAGQSWSGAVDCPDGTDVIAGGVHLGGEHQKFAVTASGPTPWAYWVGPGQWDGRVTLVEDDADGTRPFFDVIAVCVSGATVVNVHN